MSDTFAQAVTTLCASICWLTWTARRRDAARYRQRMDDLHEAEMQLRIHLGALATIVDHRDAPAELRRLAGEVSYALDDHDSVRRLAMWLQAAAEGHPPEPASAIGQMLQETRARTPELAAAFEGCVDSGFVAAMLRWPDTAATWRTVSARFVGIPGRELILARRLRPTDIGAAAAAPAFA